MALVSPFQVTDAKRWAGTTEDSHFKSLYLEDPQMAGEVVNRMLEATYGPNTETMLSKAPKIYFDRADDYYWKLQGSFHQNIELVEARYQGATVLTGDTGVGANYTEFELVFPVYWFSKHMIIWGEKNEYYQILVKDYREESGQFVYTVELANADANGMPGSELVAGKKFSVGFSPRERTMSQDGSDIQFSGPITMYNGFTTLRKQHKVPGDMKTRKMGAAWINPITKKKEFTWLEHVDWMFMWQFNLEKLQAKYFGQTNRDENGRVNNFGTSGNPIFISAGLRQLIELSQVTYYSTFSLDLLESILFDISEGKIGYNNRTFVIRTGERGAALIHKAIRDEASGWTPLRDDMSMYRTTSSFTKNSVGFGFQFTEWTASMGIKVVIEVEQLYNDQVRNKIRHPDGGFAESYRMDIFDIGDNDAGAPNMQSAYVTGAEDILRYEIGIRSPWDASANNIVSNSEDSWVMHRFAQCGVIVRDPLRTASLIPNVLAA